MDYFWKENKKFVLAVGGGLLGVMVYHWVVLGPIRGGAAAAEKSRQQQTADLKARMAEGVPAADVVASAKRDRDGLRKALASAVKDVEFRLPERYAKPDRQGAKAHFDDLRLDVEKELREKATKAKVDFQGGLGLPEDSRPEEIPDLLRRMAAAERLVLLAIEAGVEKIEQVDAMAEAGSGAASPGTPAGGAVSALPVFMKFKAGSEAAFRVLHGAQKKGAYLAVTQFEFVREDVARDRGSAAIMGALLRVEDKPAEPRP
ncbi:MAG TPA: hypothetical protein VEJ18_20930 [Planctomycetota bacterium]|nr:hypothetical protein [Planctomycetota bacterium]